MRHLVLTALAGFAVLFSAAVAAHEYKVGAITVGHPYAFASIGKVPNGAGFLTLKNAGAADRLVEVRSDIAERTELHTHIMEGGVMRMRPVEGIDVPADGEVALEPGGHHIMLLGLEAPLVAGQRVPVELVFRDAGAVTVELAVQARGETGAGTDGHSKHE